MQVEGRDDRHRRPYHLAHHGEHIAVRIMGMGGDGAAMLADIDAVYRLGGSQIAPTILQEILEERLFHRPGRH